MPNPNPPDIKVNLVNNVISTVPNKVKAEKDPGETTTLTWITNIPFTEFPDPAAGYVYFAWKEPAGKPPIPTRVNANKLQLTYPAPTVPEVWAYTIWCQPVNGTPIGQDPEVDNTRPGGGTAYTTTTKSSSTKKTKSSAKK